MDPKNLPSTGSNILEQGEFLLFTRTEYTLTFVPNCPEEAWLAEMRKHFNIFEGMEHGRRRLLCYISDGLKFGEYAYGEKYSQAISEAVAFLKIGRKTTEKLVAMYQQLPAEARAIEVSETHFEVVAIKAIPDSEKVRLLNNAKDEGLTVSEFKKIVNEEAAEKGWKKRKPKKVNSEGKTPEIIVADKNDTEGMRHMLHAVADFLEVPERFSREQWNLESLKMWETDLKRIAKAAKRLVFNGGHKKK